MSRTALATGNLILVEDIQGLAGIAQSACVVGNDALQSIRDAMCSQHIGLAGVPDHAEIILGRDLVDRNQLEAFGLSASGMDKMPALSRSRQSCFAPSMHRPIKCYVAEGSWHLPPACF